jgi:hypothetical protein
VGHVQAGVEPLAMSPDLANHDVGVDAPLIPVADDGVGMFLEAHVFEVAVGVPEDLFVRGIFSWGVGQGVVHHDLFGIRTEPPDQAELSAQFTHILPGQSATNEAGTGPRKARVFVHQ